MYTIFKRVCLKHMSNKIYDDIVQVHCCVVTMRRVQYEHLSTASISVGYRTLRSVDLLQL